MRSADEREAALDGGARQECAPITLGDLITTPYEPVPTRYLAASSELASRRTIMELCTNGRPCGGETLQYSPITQTSQLVIWGVDFCVPFAGKCLGGAAREERRAGERGEGSVLKEGLMG